MIFYFIQNTLRYALLPRSPAAITITQIPMRYTIQDLFEPYSTEHGFIPTTLPDNTFSILHRIDQDISDDNTEWKPIVEDVLHQYRPSPILTRPLLAAQLASWTIEDPQPNQPPILVFKASPKELRLHWNSKNKQCLAIPLPTIPLAPAPGTLMSKQKWKTFWKTGIPHAVRNCWWRLLLGKLPTKSALRHVRVNIDGNQCHFCQQDETPVHMIMQCPRKHSFWMVARKITNIELNTTDIWQAITFQKKVERSTLVTIGEIMLIIWRMHWRCIIDDHIWNTTHALRQLRLLRWNRSGTNPGYTEWTNLPLTPIDID
ncbi:unnamed protein product [Absidia cylindrospora]